MDIAIGFDISLDITGPNLLLGCLSVHPSVVPQLHAPEQLVITPALPHTQYIRQTCACQGLFVRKALDKRLEFRHHAWHLCLL